jgi:diguanylate cyclase (GGDEF)-like protein
MRRVALVGLVASLLLGAIAVSVTNDGVRAKRSEQDRSLQDATSAEIALIYGGERQTQTALSLMLVNPAVRSLLGAQPLSAGARRSDIANAILTLAAIQHTSYVALSAACLDDASGRQLACAPTPRPATFPTRLGRQFVALAAGAQIGAASGTFNSPVSGQLSVAFLAPFRAHGRLRGLVHLDISIADTLGSRLVRNSTPGTVIQLGGYEHGQLFLNSPAGGAPSGVFDSASTLPLAAPLVGARPQYLERAGHRAIAAALPLTIGVEHQQVAVAATAIGLDPTFFNSWSGGMLALLALALSALVGSTAGLIVSSRGLKRELSTDPLTGLRNRRALMEELPRVCQGASEDEPVYLWYFDLNGFKLYNDSFGHIAGDTLLSRLGDRLRSTIEPYGTSYRLGGDEFCALVGGCVKDPHALFQETREAMAEQGGAFAVTASAGAVEIPREATDPMQALRIADQRMYAEKGSNQSGAAELITAALHAALAQRHPDLGQHSDSVASDIEMLARAVGLDADGVDIVVQAGDLHDIGKLGIPDEIITKPGPLTPEEWGFMKQHTVMGEQIIAAAGPSLERVRPLVRASHERWDGLGYPDGLSASDIPLGARIIAVCDSFSAMTTERVYKPAMSATEALAELRRNAGTQFDPELVKAFGRIIAGRIAAEQTTSLTS